MAGCVRPLDWRLLSKTQVCTDHYHETISHLLEVPLSNTWAHSGPHGRECVKSRSQVFWAFRPYTFRLPKWAGGSGHTEGYVLKSSEAFSQLPCWPWLNPCVSHPPAWAGRLFYHCTTCGLTVHLYAKLIMRCDIWEGGNRRGWEEAGFWSVH